MTENGLSAADIYAVTRNNDSNNGNGMWNGDWFAYILLFALLGGGYGGFGGFGGGGILPWLLFGNGGFGGFGGGSACATQADLAAGFANSAVLSSLDDIKLGQANAINYNNQGFAGLNTAILQGFHGVDNAVCTLGYQTQQAASGLSAQLADCCCGIKGEIKDVTYGNERNSWTLSKQISDCCCDIEKMNMQNRFDAQAYNCNTLQAIDKLGDRIVDHLNAKENQALRDEVQALRLAASQAKQNEYLISRLDPNPCPTPAYVVQPPQQVTFPTNCCGTVNYASSGCGCGSF